MLLTLAGQDAPGGHRRLLAPFAGPPPEDLFRGNDVTFRPLTRDQIRRYHAQVNPLDKAGAYGIQEQGETLVEAIFGSFTNVIGLPLERLSAELPAFGFRLPKETRRIQKNVSGRLKRPKLVMSSWLLSPSWRPMSAQAYIPKFGLCAYCVPSFLVS